MIYEFTPVAPDLWEIHNNICPLSPPILWERMWKWAVNLDFSQSRQARVIWEKKKKLCSTVYHTGSANGGLSSLTPQIEWDLDWFFMRWPISGQCLDYPDALYAFSLLSGLLCQLLFHSVHLAHCLSIILCIRSPLLSSIVTQGCPTHDLCSCETHGPQVGSGQGSWVWITGLLRTSCVTKLLIVDLFSTLK